MTGSIYNINKGVNQPIRFRGLQAQYIWYLGIGITILLVAFAILYISGAGPWVSTGLIGVAGIILFRYVYHLSNTFGQYGLMKKAARRKVPGVIKIYSRNCFM